MLINHHLEKMGLSPAWIYLLLCAQIISSTPDNFAQHIAHRYQADSSFPLIHQALNSKDGFVYISAVNRLYQLNLELDEGTLVQDVTGPVNDSTNCLPYLNSCTDDAVKSNNYNKILLMDYDRDRILVCGSIYQGICDARSLQDIRRIVSANRTNYAFEVSDYVACSSKDCTSIGVITEGPTVLNPVLYVGSTVVYNIYRTADNSINTRSLYVDPTRENLLFRWAIDGARKSTVPLNEAASMKFFKYSFATEGVDGFVYFLFQKILSTTMVSVVARICKNDLYYSSYVEMNLTCPGLSTDMDTSLVGAYYLKNVGRGNFPLVNTSEGVLYTMFKNTTGSSLCIFTIENLNAAFDETFLACQKYGGGVAPEGGRIADKIDPKKGYFCDKKPTWMTPDQALDDPVVRPDDFPILDYYTNQTVTKGKIRCGAQYLATQIKRIHPIVAPWSYYYENANFSALAVHVADDGINVAYIGTEEGKILELNVNDRNLYNELLVGKPVLSDMILHEDNSLAVPHLYVMTPNEVFHLRVSVCDQYKTCTDCLQANDPYCGWCILKSRCTPVSSECPTNSWLKPLTKQCIQASRPEPLERTLMGEIMTKVDLLPRLTPSESYKCVFNDAYAVPATVDPSDGATVTCSAPPSEELPLNMEGEDFVDVPLSIRYNGETDIVTTTATFYECNAHGRTLDKLQPCNGCITNQWMNKCQWCVTSHSCVPRETGSCTTVSDQCPLVTMATPESRLLSVGLPNVITLDVMNLPTSNAEYSCRIEIDGNEKAYSVPAERSDSGSQIICSERSYSYVKDATEVQANVTVFWKPEFVIDTQNFNPISFYNCSIDHDDCSICVTTKPSYKCGWCGSTATCVAQELCKNNWITDSNQCPEPKILSFSPTSGPLSGDTIVTIRGENMGVSPSDVESLSIAGIPCIVKPNLYQVSKQIACASGVSPAASTGKITAVIRGISKSSVGEFHYRNPVLEKILTPTGPKAGGTTLTIAGKDLDTGFSRAVFIGNYEIPCEIVDSETTSTTMKCRTLPSEPALDQTVTVRFDSYYARLDGAFSYVENPEIKAFSTATPGKLASFLAGGRDIVFIGVRLDLVENAELIAQVDISDVSDTVMQQLDNKRRRRRSLMKRIVRKMIGKSFRSRRSVHRQFSSTCNVVNETHMICPSPKVSLTIGDNITRNISDTMFVSSDLVLVMDNIKEPLEGRLKYYPNPLVEELDKQTQKKEWRNGSLLKIKVLNLNEDAISEDEIKITIGEKVCPVDSMDDVGLLCILPEMPEGKKSKFEVQVNIGYKMWSIGSITYFVQPPLISEEIKYVLIGAGVLLGLAIIVAIFYCFKKNKHYKENKNEFQKVIENLEMSVRADFRKAFAELSIDMTDLTADIGDVGLPILSYRQYATYMFFPSVRYHPCMKEPDPTEKPIPAVEQGLSQFNLLITNKHFLISFLRTLEQQRGFSNRDKGNVASLITVVLHKKLDYFTEVMKTLISELIAASVQRNPKLVLRRTESVAERMYTNWMAICLFPYIRDKAGKPIFLLQKAIKHQVSKGALDAITGKARYTLSDDRLLKEDIPSELLTLFVSQTGSADDEPVIVKVLSCDSIAQVKEKVMDAVYKRIPFSQRPRAEQLDLEWRHGRSGHLILPDIDYANEPGSRWRRVMTIKDYKVDSNATMALIQRQQDMYGSQDIIGHYANQSPDTSVVSPMLPEENAKIYHLVKYTDDLEQKRESTIPRDRHKHILDLYLLRLINMKGILNSYVDEVFQAILNTNTIPMAVKHFFDFLDDIAKTQGIDDPEILHIWKTNSVFGRFWVTILKNPESVFDIDKPDTVESSMSVISQTFIDACSVQEHKPTKDSPINKQLYAKEIPTYKKMVQKYYQDVHDMQPVSDQDICAHMAEISRSHDIDFDVHVAYNELWGYVNKYYEEIQETLSNDPNTTQMVIQRLQQAYTLIDSSVNNP